MPPRAIYLRWPLGHPFGEPFNESQQERIVLELLRLVKTATEPGKLYMPSFRWKRTDYSKLPPVEIE